MSVTYAIWLFRRRVVATSLGESGSAAARRFGVHRSTVYEWRKAFDFLTERRIVAGMLGQQGHRISSSGVRRATDCSHVIRVGIRPRVHRYARRDRRGRGFSCLVQTRRRMNTA